MRKEWVGGKERMRARTSQQPATNWMRTWVAGQCDTIVDHRTGILIHLAETGIPAIWEKPPCNAKALPAEQTPGFRASLHVLEAMNAYPDDLVGRFISRVYLLNHLEWEGRELGGSCIGSGIYIVVRDIQPSETPKAVRDCFNHEVAHRLWKSLPDLVKTTVWRTYNPSGFIYKGRARTTGDPQDILCDDPKLYAEGFVCPYGQTTMEEDMCTLAERLFAAEPSFLSQLPKHPRLAQKARLLDEFYFNLSPRHTWPWMGKVDLPKPIQY